MNEEPSAVIVNPEASASATPPNNGRMSTVTRLQRLRARIRARARRLNGSIEPDGQISRTDEVSDEERNVGTEQSQPQR